ncbi:molybdopterin binding oxidoreductase [Setomelanomma holmii]|uniref:Molybdopterin binding oxidoreductase n=1 Tax=Setomelanomma holmii TaxID=210430 RepID=A0A9P4LHH4_9PLEO|nr:molybdopterin binding oxidoreductase [Setomelanomma holmii]
MPLTVSQNLKHGLVGAELPVLDMTGPETKTLDPQVFGELTGDDEAIKSVGDRDELFARERKGWVGFVEWENYPEKKAAAHKILTSQTFPPNPEFQLGPIPATNPLLPGNRWEMWHHEVGGELTQIPDDSWTLVLKEKHPDMLHLLQFPYNREPPKRLVTDKVVTPDSLHLVRNHGCIPIIDKEDFSFVMDGLVKTPQSFTLGDLMDESRFPRVEKLATIQCSGMRRIEQILKYPGQGDEVPQAPWAEGAIGTATWVGLSLKKVIKACGGLVDGAGHLEFYGADTYFKDDHVMNYLVGVLWSKVKANEVLLAWEMNGEALPRIHVYPLRVVVLGYIGARNSGDACQSAIMSPWTKQAVIQNGKIRCKGWAYSGGGRWPEHIELSMDGGFNWYIVWLENLSEKRKWSWRTWEYDLPCNVEGWVEIVVRCWDNSLNTQPSEVRTSWNWGLHVTSSCHRISIYSLNKSRPVTKARLDEFE